MDTRSRHRLTKRIAPAVLLSLGAHLAMVAVVVLRVTPPAREHYTVPVDLVRSWPSLRQAVKHRASSRHPTVPVLTGPIAVRGDTAPVAPEQGQSVPPSAAPRLSAAAVAALQFGAACREALDRAKTLPPGCVRGTAPVPLGPRRVPEFQAEAAAIDRHIAYKESPGSPDLWHQANHMPMPNDRPNDLPEYGMYDGKPLKQRVIGGCGETSSCTGDGHDPRNPDYHPGVVKWANPDDK